MNKNIQLEDFYFKHKINTRLKDLDAFRHVNNAVFLSYIEDARHALIRRWGLDYESKSIIAASIKIDYLKQVKHPSSLIIGQRVCRIGNTSFDIESALFIKGEEKPVCVCLITCVAFDFKLNKSVKVHPEIIKDYNL